MATSTLSQKFLWQFLARKLRRIVDRRLRKLMCINAIHINLRSAIIRALAPKLPQKLLRQSTSRFITVLGIFCILLLAGCGKDRSGYDYKVALDASWYSLELPGREGELTAFTTELIEAIGKEEKLKIGIYQRSWDNLMLGLQQNDYQAICTPMQPYIFYEKLYVFSDIYLPTGPVLIVANSAKWSSLEQLSGLEVGIVKGSSYALILEKYPSIIQRTYGTISAAFEDLKQNEIQAVVLDILSAEAYTRDLYEGQLKISSPPLSPEGLRLVGLHGRSEELIRRFNKGLSKLKSKGIYTQIAKKWNVGEAN